MPKRITYTALSRAVDEWNKEHGMKPQTNGELLVCNDGPVVWLAFYRDGGVDAIGGTSGTPRSCMARLTYLQPKGT